MSLYNLNAGTAAPAVSAASVTPNDSTDLTRIPTRGIYVGAGGDINLDMADGTTILFSSVPGGTVLPVQARRVRSTSTTATSLVALY